MHCIKKVQGLVSQANINCIHAFFATCFFKRDGVSFADLILQTGNMDENFLTRRRFFNKTETFGFIEELYCTCKH